MWLSVEEQGYSAKRGAANLSVTVFSMFSWFGGRWGANLYMTSILCVFCVCEGGAGGEGFLIKPLLGFSIFSLVEGGGGC